MLNKMTEFKENEVFGLKVDQLSAINLIGLCVARNLQNGGFHTVHLQMFKAPLLFIFGKFELILHDHILLKEFC